MPKYIIEREILASSDTPLRMTLSHLTQSPNIHHTTILQTPDGYTLQTKAYANGKVHPVCGEDGKSVVFKRRCDAADAALGFSKRVRMGEKPKSYRSLCRRF